MYSCVGSRGHGEIAADSRSLASPSVENSSCLARGWRYVGDASDSSVRKEGVIGGPYFSVQPPIPSHDYPLGSLFSATIIPADLSLGSASLSSPSPHSAKRFSSSNSICRTRSSFLPCLTAAVSIAARR